MRKILFKAKRKDDGEWVEGDLLRETDYFEDVITRIYVMKARHTFIKHEVIQETVCQYTGLTDGTGNRIWENDTICWRDISGKYYHAVIKFGRYGNMDYGFYLKWMEDIGMRPNLAYWADKVEVVGNVFDNPEILEGENGDT